MRSICTSTCCARRRRLGTAEIELLLVIPVLLAFLLLAGGALALGTGRLANVFHAENNAYTQIETGQGLTAGAVAPIEGIATFRPVPALPNRFAYAEPTQTVQLNLGEKSTQLAHTFDDRAVFLDPTWHLDNQPALGDPGALQAWFTDYVAESHSADLVNSLGLQPAGPP
jgi:hypothetical protein